MENDMDIYMDANFTGNYDNQNIQSRYTSRSRNRYIVMYKEFLVSCKFQLQTEICLSSVWSEYTGL